MYVVGVYICVFGIAVLEGAVAVHGAGAGTAGNWLLAVPSLLTCGGPAAIACNGICKDGVTGSCRFALAAGMVASTVAVI